MNSEQSTMQARLAGWTEAEDETLRDLMASGEHSFRSAGELLGKGYASVGRRVRSLGIVLPENHQTEQMMRTRGFTGTWGGPAEQYPEIAEFETIPDASKVTFAELESGMCKWPSDAPEDVDGSHVFCGTKSALGKPYCQFHIRMAYEPPKGRKRAGYIELGKSHGGIFGRAG